jgi:hypothetical protein
MAEDDHKTAFRLLQEAKKKRRDALQHIDALLIAYFNSLKETALKDDRLSTWARNLFEEKA